ncbi:MAG: cellulase N-terminal Ig-like domain-containing protein [Segetibacter sp.]
MVIIQTHPKIAIVTGSTDAQTFYITSTNIRDTLFSGKLSEEKQSLNSSTKTRIADFSSLQTSGTFFVLIPGVGHSYVFDIGNSVNRPGCCCRFERLLLPACFYAAR